MLLSAFKSIIITINNKKIKLWKILLLKSAL